MGVYLGEAFIRFGAEALIVFLIGMLGSALLRARRSPSFLCWKTIRELLLIAVVSVFACESINILIYQVLGVPAGNVWNDQVYTISNTILVPLTVAFMVAASTYEKEPH